VGSSTKYVDLQGRRNGEIHVDGITVALKEVACYRVTIIERGGRFPKSQILLVGPILWTTPKDFYL